MSRVPGVGLKGVRPQCAGFSLGFSCLGFGFCAN